MMVFKADLHIHTVLSPCGSLEMSPAQIVKSAVENQIDIIGITDHNSTRQCRTVISEAQKAGITVYCGAEVTTKEEVHCLAFFEDIETLDKFQLYLDQYLPEIQNNPDLFGYQVVVNESEDIIFEEERLLISAISRNINQVEEEVHRLKGIFIPAHVNKTKYSLVSQLGFIPPDLKFDALELSKHMETGTFLKSFPYLKNATILHNSDAHQPEYIGTIYTELLMESTDFKEFRLALKNSEGRMVIK
ncbi:MAG TPA: PHP domain-containing protein [Lentimicrobium sp.]|nr:PHP domain-containing protein [Lentimicrobium sp.]